MHPTSRPTTTPRRPGVWARLALAGVISLGVAPAAIGAQPVAASSELDQSVLTARTSGSRQREQVEAYFGALRERLESDDPAEFDRAAEQLAEPLVRAIAAPARRSVAFRLLYEEVVGNALDRMLRSDDPRRVMLGLRVSGQLATDATLGRLTPSLSSSEPGLRLFASAQARSTFAVLAGGEATMSQEVAIRLVDAIGEAIESERNPRALDSHVRALIQASLVLGEDVEDVGPHATARLAQSVGVRTRAIPADISTPEDLVPTLRALSSLRERLIDRQYPLTPESGVQAVGLAADAMAFALARRVAESPSLGPSEPAGPSGPIGAGDPVELQLVALAEVVERFGRGRVARLVGGNPPADVQTPYSELMRRAMLAEGEGDQRRTLEDLQGALRAFFESLSAGPYNFPTVDRFFNRN